jgi:hypothetical protein
MIKSKRVRWAGYVTCIGIRRMHTGFLWENQKEGDHNKYLCTDERIILKWIFKK